jgi:hypothetical protein
LKIKSALATQKSLAIKTKRHHKKASTANSSSCTIIKAFPSLLANHNENENKMSSYNGQESISCTESEADEEVNESDEKKIKDTAIDKNFEIFNQPNAANSEALRP